MTLLNLRRLDTGLAVAEPADNRNVGGSAPVLVLLHGFGKYHGHLLDLWPTTGIDWSLVAIRAGFRMGPSVYRWFAYEDLPGGRVAIARGEEQRSRDALIAYLDERHRDEPDRPLFLFGHSQGGMMALSVALLRADLITGCAVLNGRILPETLALLPNRPDLACLPVFVGHGISDTTVKIDSGRSARAALEGMGASLTYREYRGGHDITPDMVADVVAWLRTTLEVS
ncbi:alpha/beta hydrolase [Nocardia sp. NPDC051052]|uniref:alpha/beta hydrolase n=1 Tax=Nocardia sp. NPDC051052 TaxID=3364322 RepID=UPI0037972B69